MNQAPTLPRAENIPALHSNVEGLKRHSFMCVFVPDSLSPDERKFRAWLLHTLTTAARHYSAARELVRKQDSADQSRDGGAVFYLLDVSEQIEGCVLALFRVCAALHRMGDGALESFAVQVQLLREIRNQFDHMHGQIVSAETGRGPISITFVDEGRSIRFRRLKMKTTDIHALVEEAYRFVAAMFPNFDADSAPEPQGPIKLTMAATVTVIDHSTGQQTEI